MEWFDIKGFEGYYEINLEGKVRNYRSKRELKPILYSHGYLVVRLRKNNKVHQKYIHRLIATTFIDNPNPKNTVVNHIDGNKLNNNINNLEWTTIGRNVSMAWGAGLNDCRGAKNGRAIVNEDDVREMRKLHKEGKTIKELAITYGLSRNATSCIVNYKTWTHIE